MATKGKTRTELRQYFVKNAIPTEGNFADLIEAQINQTDDGVLKEAGQPLGLVAAAGEQRRVLQLYSDYPAANPDWLISLKPKELAAPVTPPAGVRPSAPSGPTNLRLDAAGDLPVAQLGIADGAGNTRLLLDSAGNLTVAGDVIVRNDLYVSGSRIRNKSGLGIVEANADDWLRINPDQKFPAIALYKPVAIGSGGLSVGEWQQLPAGQLRVTGAATILGGLTVGPVQTSGNAGVLDIEGNDHAYIQWYPMKRAAGRKGWIGYGSANTTTMSIQNDAGVLALRGTTVAVGSALSVAGVLEVNDFISARGVAVNNGQNTGVGIGVWLWAPNDPNHVIYSANPSGKSPANASAVAGYFNNSHRMRFRTYSGHGFLFENHQETALVDITADTGNLWAKGAMYAGNSDLYFTRTDHKHSGIGNTQGYAAIENAVDYDALMILGRKTTSRRVVKLWDYLEVHGELRIQFDNGFWSFQADGNLVKYRNDGTALWYLQKAGGGPGW